MNLLNKRIAIVGGGPGGLTLANLLQQAGAMVTVYERDLDKNARVQGSPLDLHEDSGLAAIRKAGLMEAFKASFMPGADRTTILNEEAAVFFSDHETKVEEAFGDAHFRPEIDRGVLRKMLLESLLPETVIWNRHFVSMEPQGEGWLLHFKAQEPVYADLVVGADGANSKLRSYLTDIRPFYSGITMVEGNVHQAAESVPQIDALLRGGKIMAFGKGQDILMGQKGNGDIGFYLSFHAPEDWSSASGLDFGNRAQLLQWFEAHYADWNPVWQTLIEKAELPLIPRPITCMPLDQTWMAQPNLTLLGDAAHVMPPFAGEGVNMAMRDALELSDCLLSGTFPSTQAAIAAYETAMRARAAEKANESLENGERMHHENALQMMLSFFAGHQEAANAAG